MTRLPPLRFWLSLALVSSSVALAPLFRRGQPPAQSQALGLLLGGTIALSLYLFAVILRPEKF
jgi:hypothetical protein